jgi:peptidoglycan hydrolase-like protein with peptidoglycan-binding domain
VAIAAVSVALVAASAALVISKVGSGLTPSPGATATSAHLGPLAVEGTSPVANSTGVPAGQVITVSFSAPLAADSPMPGIAPSVPGSWARTTTSSLTFTPSTTFNPGATVTVGIPGGRHGVVSARGQHLTGNTLVHFTMAPMSTLRLQELLAQLGYLPLTFTPSAGPPSASAMSSDQPGSFAWRWSTLPSVITSQWSQGQPNVITKGAVMAFEDQHGLAADGVAGPQVWAAVLHAAQANQTNSYGHWDWVDVSTSSPETVHVWRDGAMVYSTLANTGVAGAPTAAGTFPVFSRFTVTTMSGTNPDGSHYRDPGIPWVSYFNGGDALHGFVRPGYGYPQSDGCVEMPPANAAVVFPYTPLGTLVTVE